MFRVDNHNNAVVASADIEVDHQVQDQVVEDSRGNGNGSSKNDENKEDDDEDMIME